MNALATFLLVVSQRSFPSQAKPKFRCSSSALSRSSMPVQRLQRGQHEHGNSTAPSRPCACGERCPGLPLAASSADPAAYFALAVLPPFRATMMWRREEGLFGGWGQAFALFRVQPLFVIAIMHVAVIIAYYQGNALCRENVQFILDVGLGQARPDVTAVLVVNGPECDVAAAPHVHVVPRDNTGMDFGAWGAGLEFLDARVAEGTPPPSHFIFLNTSCRGPFLPVFAGAMGLHWTRAFLAQLSDTVRLVGPTINVLKRVAVSSEGKRTLHLLPHVQSYAFGIDAECCAFLRDEGLFAVAPGLTKAAVVEQHELRMSALVLGHRPATWTIASFLPDHAPLHDFAAGGRMEHLKAMATFNPAADKYSGDILFPGGCMAGRDVHPVEVMFMKTNRNLYPKAMLDSVSEATRAASKAPQV